MKVYIVMTGDFDYVCPDSAWSTEAKAMERIQQLLTAHPGVYDDQHPSKELMEFEVDVP